MLKNFQRYFRFYLAFFLVGILVIGVRWEGAAAQESAAAPVPAPAKAAPTAAHQALATR